MDLERRRRLNRNRRFDLFLLPELWTSLGVAAFSLVVFAVSLAVSAYQNGQVGKLLIMVDMLAVIAAVGNFFYALKYLLKKERDAFSRGVIFVAALVSTLAWMGLYIVGIMIQ